MLQRLVHKPFVWGIILLLTLHPLHVVGQQMEFHALMDSVKKLSGKSDSAKIMSLWKNTEPFFESSVDSVRGRANYVWGNFFYWEYEYDSAIYYLENAAFYYKRGDIISLGAGDAFYQLGSLSLDIEDVSASVEHYLSALKVYEKLEHKTYVANTYNALANAYSYIYENNLALDFYQKALSIHQTMGDTADISMVLGNIAGIYAIKEEYEKALAHYDEALAFLDDDSKSQKIDHFLGIGLVKDSQGAYAEAYGYYNKARKLAEEIKDSVQMAYIYQDFAYLLLSQDLLDSLPDYVTQAQYLAEKFNLPQIEYNLREINHEYQYKTGNYKLAYDLLDKVRAESDSFYDLDVTRQLQAVQAQYSTLKKEKEIAQKDLELAQSAGKIQRQAYLRNFLIGGLVLLIGTVLIIYRSQREKSRANRLLQKKNNEIEEKNNEIVAIEQAKSRWFINISHELRTPLTLIKGPVKQALESIPVNDHIYKDLKLADKNVNQLQKLVNEILDLSKIEDGKMHLDFRVTNLTDVVVNALASFDTAARKTKVRLELDLDPESPVYMDLDQEKITKVLNNLISNALKFTHEGGKITVGLEKMSEHVLVKVEDTGDGISFEDIEKVFDRFYQSSNPKFSRQGGTGVGLALSKEIAHLHQGELTVTSEEGKGSCFKLHLPVRLMAGAAPELEVNVPDIQTEKETERVIDYTSVLKDKTILLVDDNADMREYIAGFLKKDFRVVEARDGEDALQKVRLRQPDLIVSDIMMPRMDGVVFAREIKASEKWKNIPFITVSAIADQSEIVKTLRIGIDDYIVKPFNSEELFVRIKNLIFNYSERVTFKSEPSEEEIPQEEKTLKLLESEVYKNMDNISFNVNQLAESVFMSERQLYRYVRQMTGLTPANFIREIRLQKAMDLIQKRVYKRTSQISYAVGFQQPAYFSSVFKKRFGRFPNDYLNS